MTQYLGKHRGQVANNIDPMQLGRLQVSVPAVYGQGSLNWAMPCVPYAGPQVGLFLIPPVGANVWVEFEGGDLDYPIWTGCFWQAGQVPAPVAIPDFKVLKTDTVTITLTDTPGVSGVTIETAAGAKIAITTTGLEINNGQGGTMTLQGPNVSVNNGALEVT